MSKLKNYTTKVPASRSINQVQEALAETGASAIMMDLDPATGKVSGLMFAIEIRGNFVNFKLPVDCERFRKALLNDGVHRAQSDDDYVYRVAWRCVRDWVMAQIALIKTQMVELDQVFLPYAVSPNGSTVYQAIISGDMPLLLGASHD